MTTQEWLAEQERVWGWGEGGTHDVFGDTVERLKMAEQELRQLASMTPPEDADVLVAGIVDAMAPANAFGTGPALMRFATLRPAITARVTEALRNGVVPGHVVWIVANAFLRGDTDALEQVLPPGLRALSCEEWAAEEKAAGHQS